MNKIVDMHWRSSPSKSPKDITSHIHLTAFKEGDVTLAKITSVSATTNPEVSYGWAFRSQADTPNTLTGVRVAVEKALLHSSINSRLREALWHHLPESINEAPAQSTQADEEDEGTEFIRQVVTQLATKLLSKLEVYKLEESLESPEPIKPRERVLVKGVLSAKPVSQPITQWRPMTQNTMDVLNNECYLYSPEYCSVIGLEVKTEQGMDTPITYVGGFGTGVRRFWIGTKYGNAHWYRSDGTNEYEDGKRIIAWRFSPGFIPTSVAMPPVDRTTTLEVIYEGDPRIYRAHTTDPSWISKELPSYTIINHDTPTSLSSDVARTPKVIGWREAK